MSKEIIDLNSKVQRDFLNYANAVIKSRAISNIEDNMKPVHRRILYAMKKLHLESNKKHKKSARIVGDTVGQYHPHGDSSVYEAMVRLSQNWKMRYPLVEVQGNSGNVLGDGPAAMRYTEARLTKFGEMMLDGIDKEAVPFKETYDETSTEPSLLPSAFPNLLCNGNSGIAVGLSASLVPHNLKEVVKGIVAYLDYKAISVEDLMKYIPGPDFPTGGTITDTEEMEEIYRTGTGTVTLRSKYNIEHVGKVQHIVITEVPYLVNVETGIIEPLQKLVVEEGFDLIDDFENNTDKNGVNLRIVLKKGANVYKVLEALWQHTRLQITQRIGNTIIKDSNPATLSLKEMIKGYVDHRHDVIINMAKYDLNKTQNRLMVVNALMTALDKIDEVIDLIKKADDKSSARIRLIKFLKINEFQANAILDMKLSRLNKLDSMELKQEKSELQEKEKYLLTVIKDSKVRENIMRKELLQLSANYGDARKTTLSYDNSGAAEGLPIEPIKILMFEDGSTFATQQKPEDLSFNRKTSELNTNPVTCTIDTKTDKEITVFTADGTLWHQKVLTMATESLETGLFYSKPLAAFDFSEDVKEYMVFVTSAGIVKKTKTEEYLKAKSGSRTIRLKGDQELIYVGMADNDDNLAILDEKLAYFKVSEVTPTSKITIGSKGIQTKRAISAAIVSDKDKLLMINEEGKGKRTKASDLVHTSKGGNGQSIADNTVLISPEADVYYIYGGGKNHVITKNPATKSKGAVGSKIISKRPVSLTG